MEANRISSADSSGSPQSMDKSMGMLPDEFARIMAVITFGCGKSLNESQAEVYYAMLGDIPAPVLLIAAQKALLQPLYSAFPTIELLRRMAMEVSGPKMPTFEEAWKLASKANRSLRRHVLNADYRIVRGGKEMTPTEWNEEIYASLPDSVSKVLRSLGELFDNEACRAQFRQMYEGVVAEEKSKAMLTPAIRNELAAVEETKRLAASELAKRLATMLPSLDDEEAG